MKRLLFLYIFMTHMSSGSSFYEERIANCSPQTIETYKRYKQIVSAFFCEKAIEQKKHDIACRCGNYGLGKDWSSKYKQVKYPSLLEITNDVGETLCLVTSDMINNLPDLADWLKQNAN